MKMEITYVTTALELLLGLFQQPQRNVTFAVMQFLTAKNAIFKEDVKNVILDSSLTTSEIDVLLTLLIVLMFHE